ncbi:MAG: 50S ribosomal protein L18 [Bacteroidetes bacterium GWE2_41_25]|nr:MAG: 50S ribosomal protein L18 [Bacteroidetes bacterium GWA2_40_15]OFX97201.1 MAG: 50S ribosomal protein L18 [Bacteroidetes bacterium GWC2_40_22]OFY05095.1 MAG: 50S ribosomal protein L18 [Bacteroidetes bacterium GWE2_41_25]HAM09182.1 50S ribosomal protein L18 [Bacteroidales bacterium]HBH85671.1 50S ribosomal protein L18 [Bacteroidales bacterium]
MALTKLERRTRIKLRIRKKINGTAESPRLAVYRSNKQIYVQVVDDLKGETILSASSKEKDIAAQTGIKKTEQAKLVGKLLAEKCKEKGIEKVVFDRSGYKYHGRVKSLADAAREGGLKF